MTEAPGIGAWPLGYALFRVARLHRSLAAKYLRPSGLHSGQELVLLALWQQGPQRQVDLSCTLDADAPTMTRSIARLEAAGLVKRMRSATDGRVVIVEATEASLALRPQVEGAWNALEQLTAGDLSATEQEQIIAALDRLEANLARSSRL